MVADCWNIKQTRSSRSIEAGFNSLSPSLSLSKHRFNPTENIRMILRRRRSKKEDFFPSNFEFIHNYVHLSLIYFFIIVPRVARKNFFLIIYEINMILVLKLLIFFFGFYFACFTTIEGFLCSLFHQFQQNESKLLSINQNWKINCHNPDLIHMRFPDFKMNPIRNESVIKFYIKHYIYNDGNTKLYWWMLLPFICIYISFQSMCYHLICFWAFFLLHEMHVVYYMNK